MQEFLSEKNRTLIIVLIWSIFISLVASVPYFYGFIKDAVPEIYLGRSVVNSADTYIFLSHIESVKQGEILLPNLYSADFRDAYFIKPIYILIGLVARTTYANSLFIFHLSRFILSVVLFLTVFYFLGFIFKKFAHKFLALVLVSTSTGIGYLVDDFIPTSVDIWVPEAITFFSITEAPHFIWSLIGILILVISLLKFMRTGKAIFLVVGSIFAMFAVLEHPYLIPFLLLFPILFLFGSVKNIQSFVINSLTVTLLPFLTAVALYLFFQNSEGLSAYSKQAVLPTPGIISILTGYGLLVPLSLLGAIRGKTDDVSRYLLIIWVALLALLIYMPFAFQRRLLESLHIPIATLAAFFITGWNFKFYKILVTILLVILSLGNILLIKYFMRAIDSDTREDYVHHIYRDDLEGLLWIRNHSTADDLILANFYYSNIIPGMIGRYVYNGHRFNTVGYETKLVLFDEFFKGDIDGRKKFIEQNKPRYLFFGKVDPYEKYRQTLISEGTFSEVWSKDNVYILQSR